jgi:DNA-binding beta-propeller fold protein YncE
MQQGLARSVSSLAQARNGIDPSIALPRIQRMLRPVQAGPVGPTRLSPAAPPFGKWIYTAHLYGNDLEIYQQNGLSLTFFETLTSGVSQPQGTVATVNGWWYVANAGHANVLIYKSTVNGPVGPSGTLDDSGQVPVNVDATPNRKLVAVSNKSTTDGGSGSVSIYLDRFAEPARTLTYGNDVLAGIGVAIDHQGNCYWSFNDATSGSGSIVEFAGCNGAGAPVITGITFAGGLVFDQRDDLYYVDQNTGIYKCSGTSGCSLFASGFGDPVNINFDHKSKDLWVADAAGYIDALNPKTGQVEYKTKDVGGPTDPPFGIAAAPGG